MLIQLVLTTFAVFLNPSFAFESCPPKSFSIGDRVSLSKSFAVGSVVEIIDENKIKVQWDHIKDSDGTIEDASKLSKSTNCSQGICIGTRVMGANSVLFAGVAREIFEDGSTMVHWEGFSKNEEVVKEDAQKLARAVTCFRDQSSNGVFDKFICAGDRIRQVSSPSAKKGTVVELFENRKAKVLYDDFANNGPVTEDFDNMSRIQSCE